MAPLRCLIVDDNPSFLQTAQEVLRRQGLDVIGLASTIAEALRQAQELEPEVVLVDITLGSESGFDLARRLAEMDAGSPTVILISTHCETDFADLIDKAPATGFLPKAELSASAIQRLAEAT